MEVVDQMFELAIDLRDNGELQQAVEVLCKIIDIYSEEKRLDGTYSVLGGIYLDLKEQEKALASFKKATSANPQSELASLGLYISYADLDKGNEAMMELTRYLKNYPADLYKDTLEELLLGLQDGFTTDYKADIEGFAELNGVKLS